MKKLLQLNNVSLNYHTPKSQTLAVKDLSFSIDEGEFTSIIGPSGCGKTTVLSMIAGLLKPSSGEIFIGDNKVVKTDDKIAYMLQKDHLFEWRTILNNVLLPLEIKRIKNKENVAYAKELLEKYGLGEFSAFYPNQLSGGMRQRVALIRTLTQKPELLLLDEPFSALDYQTRLSVCDDVYSIIKSEKKTVLLVTHDISEAISLSDKLIVLTKRPATVKNIHKLDIDVNLPPLKRREDKRFSYWFELLYSEINNEKT